MNAVLIGRNGEQYGPYTEDEVRRYVTDGNVLATDLAWKEGMSDWIAVGKLFPDLGAVLAELGDNVDFTGSLGSNRAIHSVPHASCVLDSVPDNTSVAGGQAHQDICPAPNTTKWLLWGAPIALAMGLTVLIVDKEKLGGVTVPVVSASKSSTETNSEMTCEDYRKQKLAHQRIDQMLNLGASREVMEIDQKAARRGCGRPNDPIDSALRAVESSSLPVCSSLANQVRQIQSIILRQPRDMRARSAYEQKIWDVLALAEQAGCL